MKKLIKYIPDAVTSMNLLCGILGVIAACDGKMQYAFPLMLAAALFDFCDGLAARALNAYSDMGKELDSLCDLVSFGVLPSLMLVQLMRQCTWSNSWLCCIPVIIAVFSALRLAKFNVDERQHESFMGLATPASAMICGSLSYFVATCQDSFLTQWCSGFVFIPVLCVVLSILMICDLPMFSFKLKFGKGSMDAETKARLGKCLAFFVNIAIIIAIVASLSLNWSLVVLLSFVVYILMNVVFAVLEK